MRETHAQCARLDSGALSKQKHTRKLETRTPI